LGEKVEVEILRLKFLCDKCWEIPIKNVKNRYIRHLFRLFTTLFPNHPDEENTRLYILYDAEPDSYRVLFTCSHFEHADLPAIQCFLDRLGPLSKWGEMGVSLCYLDTHSEQIIIEIDTVDKRTIKGLLKRAKEYL